MASLRCYPKLYNPKLLKKKEIKGETGLIDNRIMAHLKRTGILPR